MSIIRTYLSGCIWCNATGRVLAIGGITTSVYDICPVCEGRKTIIVTETIPEDVTALDQFQKSPQE